MHTQFRPAPRVIVLVFIILILVNSYYTLIVYDLGPRLINNNKADMIAMGSTI